MLIRSSLGKYNIDTLPSNISANEMLVTLDEPTYSLNDPSQITYGRMAHAVEKAAGTKQTSNSEIIDDLAGLKRPLIVHRTEPWYVMLIDGSGAGNMFEACVKLTEDGRRPIWSAPGTGRKGFTRLDQVIKVFKSVSWVEGLDKIFGEEIQRL